MFCLCPSVRTFLALTSFTAGNLRSWDGESLVPVVAPAVPWGMPFLVKSRRASVEKLLAQHPGAGVVDVTSRGPEPWVRFSPFFPHGGIPVPFSPGHTAMSVEGIWQGLKVFEKADVAPATLQIATMKGIERTVRTFGKVLGHRAGLAGDRLLPYAEARRAIYVTTYRWVLEHKLAAEVAALRKLGDGGRTVILLDYETNCDVEDLSRPLSHASLVARFLDEARVGPGGTLIALADLRIEISTAAWERACGSAWGPSVLGLVPRATSSD